MSRSCKLCNEITRMSCHVSFAMRESECHGHVSFAMRESKCQGHTGFEMAGPMTKPERH